jgi:2-polyprenyl-6-methoxyphenol hydroxylase-like FAD-dependent oxidoreductase
MSSTSALIIGGGVAGPVTAMALQKAGIQATVYEAYATSADGMGGQLTVAPNGLAALSVVGADEAVRAIGQPMNHTVMADGRGKRLASFDGLPGLPPSRAIWRSELYRALHDVAAAQGIRIDYGKKLVAVDESGDQVTARFADGSTATADVLIGADGIRSRVRTLIDPAAPEPQHVPLLNFGAVVEVTVPADPESMYFVFGGRAFLGYWVQPDGRTSWFANLPHEQPMNLRDARAISADDWLAKLSKLFADDVPGRELVEKTRADELFAFGSMQIMPSVPHWHRGRMVLVGDAVHAPSSSSGQGASLAIESGVELARCLRDLPDVQSAFTAYEGLRRHRVEKVATRAARTNSSKEFGPVARTMMGLLMPLALKTVLTPERTLGLEQRHRIEWDETVRTTPAMV